MPADLYAVPDPDPDDYEDRLAEKLYDERQRDEEARLAEADAAVPGVECFCGAELPAPWDETRSVKCPSCGAHVWQEHQT